MHNLCIIIKELCVSKVMAVLGFFFLLVDSSWLDGAATFSHVKFQTGTSNSNGHGRTSAAGLPEEAFRCCNCPSK